MANSENRSLFETKKMKIVKAQLVSFIKGLSLMTLCISLVACGGSSDSGSGSLALDREALECVEFGDGVVINLCDFDIVVRTFGGTATPVTVPANGTAVDPDATVFANIGACEAPFTPVETPNDGFECL